MLVTARITEGSPASPGVWLPPALLGALCTALWLGGPALADRLCFERAAIAGGQWWRLLSANLVHLGGWHLVLNLAGLALLVVLCPQRLHLADWLGRIVLVGAGMSLGLYYGVPQVERYVGLSGLVYGLFALGLGRQAAAGDRIAWACCALLAGRIGWQLAAGAPAAEEALIGGRVIAQSHLCGVLAALVYGVLFGVFRSPAAATTTNMEKGEQP